MKKTTSSRRKPGSRARPSVAALRAAPSREAFGKTTAPRERRGRPERSRHDLESVVEIAIRVFAERGYDGTSIGDLARAAGVTKSTIYHHVESKEKLLELCFREASRRYETLEDTLAAEATAMDRLQSMARRVIELALDEDPCITLLRRIPWMTATAPRAMKLYRSYERKVSGAITDAIDEGILRGDVDRDVLVRFFFFATAAAADVRRIDPAIPADRLAEQTLRLLFEGTARRR